MWSPVAHEGNDVRHIQRMDQCRHKLRASAGDDGGQYGHGATKGDAT